MPIGTRVRLASGGPKMLVVDVDGASLHACCAWEQFGVVAEAWFPIVCLNVIRKHHILG